MGQDEGRMTRSNVVIATAQNSMDITRQSPRAVEAHQRFLFTSQKTCIDCHKGIAHHLPDMRNVPGWQ